MNAGTRIKRMDVILLSTFTSIVVGIIVVVIICIVLSRISENRPDYAKIREENRDRAKREASYAKFKKQQEAEQLKQDNRRKGALYPLMQEIVASRPYTDLLHFINANRAWIHLICDDGTVYYSQSLPAFVLIESTNQPPRWYRSSITQEYQESTYEISSSLEAWSAFPVGNEFRTLNDDENFVIKELLRNELPDWEVIRVYKSGNRIALCPPNPPAPPVPPPVMQQKPY